MRLRNSFAMDGCDADPGVIPWARRYTRSPPHFAAQLKALLPQLVYVQESAASHGVAGEFALLPWVESHYRSASAVRAGRPAGIWQIMPVTAGAMGLHLSREYDGRRDLAAATEGVMRMLHRYHERYGDWRLVDRAYNAGEFSMSQRTANAGTASRAVMSEHLIKLLAIACVVREPARFHVTLPTLPAEQQLVAVAVARPLPLTQVAARAGMTTDALQDLNPAFRSGMLDARYADHLLLPSARAEQFRHAMRAINVVDRAGATEHRVPIIATGSIPLPATVKTPRTAGSAKGVSSGHGSPLHIVKAGESLQQIARHYAVRVAQLRHWNHLGGDAIYAGQALQVGVSR